LQTGRVSTSATTPLWKEAKKQSGKEHQFILNIPLPLVGAAHKKLPIAECGMTIENKKARITWVLYNLQSTIHNLQLYLIVSLFGDISQFGRIR